MKSFSLKAFYPTLQAGGVTGVSQIEMVGRDLMPSEEWGGGWGHIESG